MGLPRQHQNQGFECEVEDCEEEAVCCGLCANCYAAEVRWAARTPTARRHRSQQLRKYQNRLDRLKGPPKLRSI